MRHRAESDHADAPPEQLAYWVGQDVAVDRILLGERDLSDLTALAGWTRPTLGLTGGALIAMGLPEGPVVARTLVRIEREWVAENFPPRNRLQELAREEVAQALRSSQ